MYPLSFKSLCARGTGVCGCLDELVILFVVNKINLFTDLSYNKLVKVNLPLTSIKKSLDNERGGCPLSVQVTVNVRFFICS